MNSTDMKYTQKIQRAIKFSVKTHEVYQKQKRKGKDIAYITHPLTVGLILSQAGASEDVIVAGILHDTIEDSPDHKKVDAAMIKDRFGDHVAELVVSVTEADQSLPWADRKREAREHIADFSIDSLLVKSADVLSNTSEIVDDFARYGDEVFERFSASKADSLNHYLLAIEALIKRWPESPLADDLRGVAENLRKL
ncbi:HD domain-containing protein [Candidatus Falkowbacteria bacterium]|nr:HD domain-containing protein [Candidatus Falkowbacteria bacterium]